MSIEKTTSMPGRVNSPSGQRITQNVWSGFKNEKKFMDALTRFMKESWATVSQVRERTGLNPNYELSEGELSKRIEEVSSKLDEKYKEVANLEAQKAQLLSKSGNQSMQSNRSIPGSPVPQNFQPLASSTPAQQLGYSGNIDMSYAGNSSGGSYWPSSSGSASHSTRRRLQYTQGQSGSVSNCSPMCTKNSSMNSSGAYQNFSDVDYGF